MARLCKGVKGDGTGCRRPPSTDSAFCLAHDPARVDDHAGISSMGGVARHDPAVSDAKAEIADLKAALWSRKISPGAASVLLQAMRLEREIDTDALFKDSGHELVESIQSLRASGIPDLSEPANVPPVGVTSEPRVDEPHGPIDPDAPRLEDYRRTDGALDGDAFLRDSRAHHAVPLSHLTTAQRRERFASNRR